MNSSTQGGRRPPPIPVRARRSVRPAAPSNNAPVSGASLHAAPQLQPQPQSPAIPRSPGAIAQNASSEARLATHATDPIRPKVSSTETLTMEVRREVEAIVRTAVQQALSPIVREQRELEEQFFRQLRDLRAEVERIASNAASSAATPPKPVAVTAQVVTPVAAASDVAAATARVVTSSATAGNGAPVAPVRQNEFPTVDPHKAAPSADAIKVQAAFDRDLDVDWVLSGQRRRRAVSWAVGLLTLTIVGGMVVLAILSQLGYKI